ncbi:hypothetical protein WJX74_000614 [Apatococcus lobatus]|uniref:Uncharacterized protein n=1 Tax=Apatococcus lobatus TaxID=904363 RepID=A0AAW1S981_9CHLO
MAKRDAEGAPKKFSSKLLQMKFMQRAVAKQEAEAAPATKEAKVVEAEWAVPGSLKQSCRIIMEGDPRPSGITGHLSFCAFNPAIDQIHREAAEREQQRIKTEQDGKAVSDADMAAQLGSGAVGTPHKMQRTHC